MDATNKAAFGSSLFGNPFLAEARASAAPSARTSRVEEDDPAAPSALEVTILWGDQALHVMHVSPPRDVFVGEEGAVAYRLPAEKLGAPRVQIAAVDGATVYACSSSESGGRTAIERGSRVSFERGGFVFRVAVVAAGRKPVGGRARRTALAFWAASAAVHAGVVAALMLSPGDSLDHDDAGLDKSTQAYVMQLQKNAATRELEEPEQSAASEAPNATPGGSGEKHAGPAGQAGDPGKSATNAYYQIKGPAETKEVTLAKAHAMIESGKYGAIGALAAVFGPSSEAMTAFDSDADQTIGRDLTDAKGNVTGDHPGAAFGFNGLGMYGTGWGGDGQFSGIGLGQVGGFGHSYGTGDGFGPGGGIGGKPLVRKTNAIKTIEVGGDVVGKLPQEAVKRIIRASFPRFRACYEQGLKKDPGLRGTVSVRFIIDTTGAVETASLSGGSMADAQVQSCVLGVYKTMSFPEPEGGKVMVTYPIDFQNDD